MNIYIKIVLFISILVNSIAHAEIVTINNMQEIKQKFDDLIKANKPEDILGMFDIDMVLIQPSNPNMQIPNIKKNRAYVKEILKNLNNDEKNILLNLINKNSPAILVEKSTPKVISQLMRKKIKLMALTSSLAGTFEDIKNVEVWRYNTLKNFGIDFSASFPNIKGFSFTELKNVSGKEPVYYKGILCTNGEGNKMNKGDVLLAFLHKINYMPKKVIFVDDKIENIQDMEKALTNLNEKISFVGVHYQGAEIYNASEVSSQTFEEEWQHLLVQSKAVYHKMHPSEK